MHSWLTGYADSKPGNSYMRVHSKLVTKKCSLCPKPDNNVPQYNNLSHYSDADLEDQSKKVEYRKQSTASMAEDKESLLNLKESSTSSRKGRKVLENQMGSRWLATATYKNFHSLVVYIFFCVMVSALINRAVAVDFDEIVISKNEWRGQSCDCTSEKALIYGKVTSDGQTITINSSDWFNIEDQNGCVNLTIKDLKSNAGCYLITESTPTKACLTICLTYIGNLTVSQIDQTVIISNRTATLYMAVIPYNGLTQPIARLTEPIFLSASNFTTQPTTGLNYSDMKLMSAVFILDDELLKNKIEVAISIVTSHDTPTGNFASKTVNMSAPLLLPCNAGLLNATTHTTVCLFPGNVCVGVFLFMAVASCIYLWLKHNKAARHDEDKAARHDEGSRPKSRELDNKHTPSTLLNEEEKKLVIA